MSGFTPLLFAYVFPAVFLAGIVRGATGFGFSMIMIVLLTLFFPPAQVAPVILFWEVLASIGHLPFVYKQVHWKSLRWLALGVAVLETLLITLGFLYIGFTMMLTGFVVLGLFQAAIAASRMILTRIAEHAESRMSNIILRHLAFPLVWFGVCGIVIGNISSTYHLRSWLNHWARMQINVYNFLSFSVTDLLTISIVLLVLLFLLAMAKYLIFQRFENSSDLGMVSSFVTLGSYIVWALFGVFVLLILEVKYSSLLVILGGFSVGFGFALKEVLENFISGIILLVGQQVRPGDEIEFDGLYAKVKAVSFRATVIETFDGSVITLPNTNVLSKDFRNWTRRGSRMRRDLHVGVAYGSDLKLVRQTLLDAAAADLQTAAAGGLLLGVSGERDRLHAAGLGAHRRAGHRAVDAAREGGRTLRRTRHFDSVQPARPARRRSGPA